MNEEFEPTLEIGISGTGMSEEDTQKAVENIQAADIQNNIIEPEQEFPEEAIPEEVTPEVVPEEPKEKSKARLYAEDTLIGLGAGARDIASNVLTTP